MESKNQLWYDGLLEPGTEEHKAIMEQDAFFLSVEPEPELEEAASCAKEKWYTVGKWYTKGPPKVTWGNPSDRMLWLLSQANREVK